MISMRFDRLASVVHGTLYNTTAASMQFSGVSIDSRTIKHGELFFAVRGERTDGHDYIDAALRNGASGIVVRGNFERIHQFDQSMPIVAVEDTNLAFRTLAIWYRDQVAPKRLGISGSNGKTTTKEMAGRLLQAVELKSFMSPGNLNNLFGAPLAFFAMPKETKAAVIEMGVSITGEMRELIPLVSPHAAVITNVAVSHLEHLGSWEGVLAEELELVRAVSPGPVIVAEEIAARARMIRKDVLTFGLAPSSDIHPTQIEVDRSGNTRVKIDSHQFVINLFGKHQVLNLLAAYAGVRALGYSFDTVDTTALRFTTAPMRGEIEQIGNWQVIVDCYNANPASMQSGLDTLLAMPAKRHVAILSDMRELGSDEIQYHAEMGTFIASTNLDLLISVGKLADEIASAAIASGMSRNAVVCCPSIEKAQNAITRLQDGDLIYLKGSRGAALERILPILRAAVQPQGAVR
jgi:UDP-N-acetylmuramoyl-tripeptide--D-alanyl-D-alanine ligase